MSVKVLFNLSKIINSEILSDNILNSDIQQGFRCLVQQSLRRPFTTYYFWSNKLVWRILKLISDCCFISSYVLSVSLSNFHWHINICWLTQWGCQWIWDEISSLPMWHRLALQHWNNGIITGPHCRLQKCFSTHHFVVVDHHQLNIFGLRLDRGLTNESLGSPQPPRHLLLPHLVRPVLITVTSSAFPLAVLCTVWTHREAELQALFPRKCKMQTLLSQFEPNITVS